MVLLPYWALSVAQMEKVLLIHHRLIIRRVAIIIKHIVDLYRGRTRRRVLGQIPVMGGTIYFLMLLMVLQV